MHMPAPKQFGTMMWVAFISLLFLASSTKSHHQPRSDDGGSSVTIGHSYAELPEEDFQGVIAVSFVHFVPNITYQEVAKMVHDITAIGKKCAADEHAGPECAKSFQAHILEELCHEDNLAEHYGYTECCAKADQERNECLLSHKNATAGPVPPFEHPDAEEGCKAYQDNKLGTLGHFLYEIARRYTETSIPALFHATAHYEVVLETCCQQEDKEVCFNEKASAVKKELKQAILTEKQNCFLLKKFGPKVAHTLKFVQLAQKFPKAARSVLHTMSHDIVHLHVERCRGDTVESYMEQVQIIKFVCGHQDVISTKVKKCCDDVLLNRPHCLVTLENDDPPADLSPTVREFLDSNEACQHYVENHDDHLESFAYEYSRRHQDFSPLLLMRIKEGYHDLLEKCCRPDAPKTCLEEGEALLKKHVAETLEVISAHCDLYAKLGDYKFQNMLLASYTRKAPQLSFEELREYTGQLRAVATKCCHLGDDKKLICAEGSTDFVLGNICLRHQKHPINSRICQCCTHGYPFRRVCFSSIEVDEGYVPAPCAPELFTFHEDLCTANTDVEEKKQKFLVNLIKCKPAITEEQLATVIANFYGLVDKCCKAENHEECFLAEGPKLVQQIQAELS